MTSMRRTATVLRAFWQLNWLEELQYRGNFIASLLGTVFWLLMAILTAALYFRHTSKLGGWEFWDVVVLLGIFNALAGVVETVLRPGIGHLPADVRSGALDLVLVRPVDAQFYVSFRRLDVWRLADVVLGLALAGYAFAQTGRTISAWELDHLRGDVRRGDRGGLRDLGGADESRLLVRRGREHGRALRRTLRGGALPGECVPGSAPLSLRLSHPDRVDDDDSRIGIHWPSSPRTRDLGARVGIAALVREPTALARRAQALHERGRMSEAMACAASPFAACPFSCSPAGGANIASGNDVACAFTATNDDLAVSVALMIPPPFFMASLNA